jgi:hypothetical protein
MEQTYMLPEFWASAIVNDDLSGMSNEDAEQFNAWMKKFRPGYCAEVSEDSEFRRYHDAKGYVLACNCLEFTFRSL